MKTRFDKLPVGARFHFYNDSEWNVKISETGYRTMYDETERAEPSDVVREYNGLACNGEQIGEPYKMPVEGTPARSEHENCDRCARKLHPRFVMLGRVNGIRVQVCSPRCWWELRNVWR